MPVVETKGSASSQGFGEFAKSGGAANYIEDVFSTWLYTGDGTTQTITNGIDLSTKGGLVWMKNRAANSGLTESHGLFDTARGPYYGLNSNGTAASTNYADMGVSAFNTTGFDTKNRANPGAGWNNTGITYASWTFRKQAKFFDVVTYTGNGANRTIAHNLGSVPGCIIVKRTDTTGAWAVYHRSLANTEYMVLNTTAAKATGATYWNSTTPTSTEFSLGTATDVNANSGTYVAYLFAHDAGGFGLTGSDNVISCGSFTVSSGTGSTDVNLGYEPQWLLAKPSTDPGFATNWDLYDTMRGWVNTTGAGNVNRRLNPNTATQETTDVNFQPTATGFTMLNSNVYPGASITYIYIAIRRGPMKTPTSGTSVFAPFTYTGNGTANTNRSTGILTDMVWSYERNGNAQPVDYDRLRGATFSLQLNGTGAQNSQNGVSSFARMDGYIAGADATSGSINYSGWSYVNWAFRRAPNFFDQVCYTGNSTNNRALNHNLGVAPELIIYKRRNIAADWVVMSSMFTNAGDALFLQSTSAISSNAYSGVPRPTATYFYAGDWGALNNNADTYVAYLFASCPGVSKVGSYSGTGATQTISCGFAARFVMIKRTDSTGYWWLWDTARGMVAGTDPRLNFPSATGETNANWVYTNASGFQIVTTDAGVNASGGTYIYLCVA